MKNRVRSMKTIGLIGGTTWHSTLLYYQYLNETVQRQLGKSHSARCLLYAMDFEEVMVQQWGDWARIAEALVPMGETLERAGADLLVICANTPHMIADQLEDALSIPLVHIADAVGEAIKEKGLDCVGLLGTVITMNEAFITQRITKKYGVEVIVPQVSDQQVIESIILEELTHNIIKPFSRRRYGHIIDRLVRTGAQGIVLGCTEIPLLIQQKDVRVPVFDSTRIHAVKAAMMAVDDSAKKEY